MLASIYYLVSLMGLGLGYRRYKNDLEGFSAACQENSNLEALRQDKSRRDELADSPLKIEKSVSWICLALVSVPLFFMLFVELTV